MGVALCAVLGELILRQKGTRDQELCISLQSLLLQACYVKPQSVVN